MPKNPSGPGMMEMMGMLEKKVLKPHVNTPGDWWSKGILRNDPVPQPQTAEQILAEKNDFMRCGKKKPILHLMSIKIQTVTTELQQNANS